MADVIIVNVDMLDAFILRGFFGNFEGSQFFKYFNSDCNRGINDSITVGNSWRNLNAE
jgi:hypothetical protein